MRNVPNESLFTIKETLFDYCKKEFSPENKAPVQDPQCKSVSRHLSIISPLCLPCDPFFSILVVRNKLCQVLCLLLLEQYPQHWPAFFEDLVLLTGLTSNGAGAPQNSKGVDLFFRVLGALAEEIANVEITRSANEQVKYTNLVCNCLYRYY